MCHVIERGSNDLSPSQVSGGAEAAVHSIRRVIDNLPDNHVLVKLDFVNAFNSVRRDNILQSTAQNISELYKFVLASHLCEAKLMFGEHIVLSREGSQQRDPLSAVEFCDAIHPTLKKWEASTKLEYMNDVKLEGQVQVVASDVQAIIDAYSETGLRLNPPKCEIVCSNFDILNEYPVMKEFKRVKKDDLLS